MRLERVIIGVDFGAASAAAARWTARHLAPDAELTLVHCVASDGWTPPRGSPAVDDAAACLRALRAELAPARVHVEVRSGDPAECLAAIATEVGADLVVVGPHTVRGAGGRLGSTAERLLQRSATPVLLATGGLDGQPHRILVPVTGDDVSTTVLEWAEALEARTAVKLAVVHVDWRARSEGDAGSMYAPADARWPHLADGCVPGGFFVDAVAGRPAEVVSQQAERFASDLVVLDGTPSAAALAAEIGTVLRAATCAVLVTPARAGHPYTLPTAADRPRAAADARGA